MREGKALFVSGSTERAELEIKLAKGAENPLEFGHGVLSILCDVYHDGCAYAM